MLFICDFHVKKVMPQKPSEEEDGSEGAPGESVLKNSGLDLEQPQKQLCPTGKASTSGQQSKQVAGKRKILGITSLWLLWLCSSVWSRCVG